MFEINLDGERYIEELVKKNKINAISRKLLKSYPWFSCGGEYSIFYLKISKIISILKEDGASQENCINFHINLYASIGLGFHDDESFSWLIDFMRLNQYLPQLDYVNKINNYFNSYSEQVLGVDNAFLKKAVSKLSIADGIGIEDIYPEKFFFLKKNDIDLEHYDNLNLLKKFEFVFGKGFLKSGFFPEKIKDIKELIGIMVF